MFSQRVFKIASRNKKTSSEVVISFSLTTPPPPYPDKPPARPTVKSLIRSISAPFGSVSAPFDSVWLLFGSFSGPFRVRFGSVSGRWVGSEWGRGEGLLYKGKEYLVDISAPKKNIYPPPPPRNTLPGPVCATLPPLLRNPAPLSIS